MMWVIFGLVMAMLWSRNWQGDWRGRSWQRRAGFLKEYEERIAALEADLAGRDDAIGLLESRVNELESRLDFTERLLLQKADSGLGT